MTTLNEMLQRLHNILGDQEIGEGCTQANKLFCHNLKGRFGNVVQDTQNCMRKIQQRLVDEESVDKIIISQDFHVLVSGLDKINGHISEYLGILEGVLPNGGVRETYDHHRQYFSGLRTKIDGFSVGFKNMRSLSQPATAHLPSR